MKFADVKTKAEAYILLDRLATRKEYQQALIREGLDFDYIVGNIKGIIDGDDTGGVRLSALRLIMESLGVATYEKDEDSGRGWEQVLIDVTNREKQTNFEQNKLLAPIDVDYEVKVPQIPSSVEEQRKKEAEIGKDLYGK